MNEKIMTDRSLIVLALDALDELNYSNSTESAEYQYYEATKLLRAALEQPPRQPLTEEAVLDAFCTTPNIHQFVSAFKAGVQFAERHHGIKEQK